MSAPTTPRVGRLRPVRGVLPAALIGALALTCGVALTATSGWLIVAASFKPQILTLLAAIVLVRTFGMARPALRYWERVRSHDAALAHLAADRAATYAALIPLTPARLGRRSRGDVLASVVDDLDDLAYAQVRVVVPVVAMLVTGLIAAFVNALVLVPAAGVVLSLVVVCLGIGALDWAVEQRAQRTVLAARARVTQLCALLVQSATELAAVGGRETTVRWLEEAQADLTRAVTRQAAGRALGVALVPIAVVVHVGWMVAVVQPWVAAGLQTPLAALLVLTPVALGEVVTGVPDAVGALARAQSAAARLGRLVGQEPAVREAPGVARPGAWSATAVPALALEQVTASWVDRRPAMPATDLSIPPGTHVALVGPNGAGKSTVLAVLARHLDPDHGTYRQDAYDVAALPLEAARERLAVVDDEPHVFASSLRENLRLARPDATDEAVVDALRRAGLGAWFDGLESGLDTRLGSGGVGVSGGERTRLAIARAIASGRPVLLLDEPVAHLDHPTATAVMADLRAAGAGRTLVVVAHRPEGVQDADLTIRLDPPARNPVTVSEADAPMSR